MFGKEWFVVNPEQLLFAPTHEWVQVETGADGQKIATVGLSKFAVDALTDLVFIDLPEVGQQVQAGQPLGEIESVKAVSDIYSPIDGEVIEVNSGVRDALDWLSDDPYGKGWLVKIKITDESGLAELVDHATYQRKIAESS